jgi:acetylornithine deacetylase/succinyl-diaminopimelate desuccinylase-like protein
MVEGMSASSSECLPDLIAREAAARRGFLTDVDYVVTSAGLWPAAGAPSVVYATRGIATFDVQVAGGSRLLPSGEYAGAVAEPMTDLVQLLATVTAGVHGGVGIDGCGAAAVRPVSPAEQALIDAAAAPTAAAVRAAAGNVPGLIGATDGEVQLNRTRMPAVSVHGVEGAHSGPGVNTVIPAVVSGKFSVRVGPGMDAVAVTAAVTRALEARFKELGSPNELTIVSVASDPWEADPASPLYLAAFRAVERATGRAPVPTRSGHSLPVLNELERRVGAPILVLPLSGPVAAGAAGARAAGAPVGPDDDTVSRADFLTAAVTLATLIAEIAAVHDALGGPDAAATRRRAAAAERGNTGALGRIKEIWKGLA